MPQYDYLTNPIKTTDGNKQVPQLYFDNAATSRPPYTFTGNVNIGIDISYASIHVANTSSPFFIRHNGQTLGPWATIVSNADGQIHKVIELYSGKYISARYPAQGYSDPRVIDIFFYNANGTLISEAPSAYIANDIPELCFTVLEDTNGNPYFAIEYVIAYNSVEKGWYLRTIGSGTTGFVTQADIGENYEWQPVTHLAGNNNQFYLDLAQIDESIIGDGETPASTTDASKFVLPDGADISRLLANVPNNTETTIAYSGHHFMTVTRRYVVTETDHNLIYYTFKFYYDDNPPVYTSPEFAINDPPTSRQYLSFIIDDEHEVAALDIITKYPLIGSYTYNNTALPDAQDLNDIWYWLSTNGGHTEDDPYATGSTDDGGTPGNPRPQDHINDSPAPTLSGLNLGIVTLYQPTDTELAAISSFLWSDDVLDNFKKYFNNFADNIMALYILPFTPSGLSTKIFKVGKMASEDPSLQAVKFCTQRYYDIDMGSVEIGQRWGSYLDYAPYTKVEVYLPYCGIHSLDIDELMSPSKTDGTLPIEQGCTLSLKYRLDILTGVIVAKLLINGDVRYQFNGKVGSNTPLTGQTYTNWIGSIITAGAGAAMTIASGGMTAPMVAGAAASVAGTVLAQKPNVESVGNISGDASMLATNVPYVRISSPNKPLLKNQEVFTGYPSYKSGTVGSFSGYTEFVDAHVEGISCTEEERAEIISLLKAGVII